MKKFRLYLFVLILWSCCNNNPAKKPLEIDFEYLKQKIIIVGIVWDEKLQEKIQFGDEILAVNDWDLTKIEFCDFVLGTSIFNNNSNTIRFRSLKDSVFTLELKKEKMVFGEY